MASTNSSPTIPTLAAVDFVREHGAAAMTRDFGITFKEHSDFSNLKLFKYNQIKSDFSSHIVRQCRGLILDERSNWKPICYPYEKFFNYGESEAAEIDWTTAKVYDKVDGSLATLYHYKGTWYVSSSGTPDASGSMPGHQEFRDIFWQVWGKMKYKMPTDTSKCYMFEMFTNKQKIVVPVKQEMIYFHGLRDMQSLKELDPVPYAKQLGYHMPASFPLTSIEEVLEAAKKLTPDTAEGFVVVDSQFRRIKVKSPVYVAIAHLRTKDTNNLNYRSMLQIVRINESKEFLAYFPEWKRLHAKVLANYKALVADVALLWNDVRSVGDSADSTDFGLAIAKFLKSKNWGHNDVYFNIATRLKRGDYDSVEDLMENCDIRLLLDLVEKYGVFVEHGSWAHKEKSKADHKHHHQQHGASKLPGHFVPGPPKEPVFDTELETPEVPSSSNTISSASSSTSNSSATTPSTTANSSNTSITPIPAQAKSKPKKTAKQTAVGSKAKKRQDAELMELQATLAQIEAGRDR